MHDDTGTLRRRGEKEKVGRTRSLSISSSPSGFVLPGTQRRLLATTRGRPARKKKPPLLKAPPFEAVARRFFFRPFFFLLLHPTQRPEPGPFGPRLSSKSAGTLQQLCVRTFSTSSSVQSSFLRRRRSHLPGNF